MLALGSNIGDRLENLSSAVRLVGSIPGVRVCRVSRVWRSAPAGYRAQRWFYNAAMSIRTDLSAPRLVSRLKSVERALGRRRRFRNGPREIDIDLVLLGGQKSSRPSAIIPHPRMHLRRFVLAPAAEVAPSMVHPVAGKSVRALLRGLNGSGSAVVLKPAEHARFRALMSGRIRLVRLAGCAGGRGGRDLDPAGRG